MKDFSIRVDKFLESRNAQLLLKFLSECLKEHDNTSQACANVRELSNVLYGKQFGYTENQKTYYLKE